jgi:hypothetical protein
MNITLDKTTHANLLEVEDSTFREKFNRASFAVSHRLSDHPLFDFARLFELLKLDQSKVYWDMGDIRINQRWDEIPAARLSVEEAFSQIENCQAWMIFRSVQRDPEYLRVLEEFLAEIEERSGVDFRRQVKFKDAIIFVSSPGRISTYHIDRECSFLLQIRGDKLVYAFDKYDRTVITEQEIERFWMGEKNAPTYKEQHQNRAQEYHLKPGAGVHLPVGAPHWVKNSGTVSISLNINIHYHDSISGDVYRANHYLRKAGLKPIPPGRSAVRDALKRRLVWGLDNLRGLSRSQEAGNGPVWKQ